MALLVNGVPARPFTIETEKPAARDYSRIDIMKERSYKKYGRPREDVEKEIQDRYKEKEPVPGSPEQNPFNSYL
jgi:hypothetical protein